MESSNDPPCDLHAFDSGALTSNQAMIWLAQKLRPEAAFYNSPTTIPLGSNIDAGRFQAALAVLYARSDALRTRIDEEGGLPRRVVTNFEPDLEIADFAHDAIGLRTWIDEHSTRVLPFDRLVEHALLRAPGGDWVWFANHHQIVADGWSFGLIAPQLLAAYAEGQAPPGTPPASYADYVQFEAETRQSPRVQRAAEHWAHVAETTAEAFRFGSGQLATSESHRCVQPLDPSIAASLRRISQSPEVSLGSPAASLFVACTAVLFAYLHRISGQRVLSVGTPFLNRSQARFKQTIGCFAHVVPLVVEIEHGDGFVSLCEKVRASVFEGLRHQHVAPANPTGARLYDVFVNKLVFDGSLPEGADWHDTRHLDNAFALTLHDRGANGGIILQTQLNDALFPQAQSARVLEDLTELMESCTRAPLSSFCDVPLSTGRPRSWLSSEASDDAPGNVVDLLRRQAAETPDAIAVVEVGDPESRRSYADFDRETERIASGLCRLGVGVGVPVATLMPRGLELQLAQVSILKSGGVFCPIDPEQPAARVSALLERSAAALVLVPETDSGTLGETAPPKLTLAKSRVEPVPLPTSEPADLAYLYWTSGSTGEPKAALTRHDGLLNHLLAKNAHTRLSAGEVFVQTAPVAFDILPYQSLAPLLVGAQIQIVGDDTILRPTRMLQVLAEVGADVVEFVPTYLRLLLDSVSEEQAPIRCLVSTGESLPANLARRWFEVMPGSQIVNTYGLTECSDDVTHETLFATWEGDELLVPIGRPIPGATVSIVDACGQLVPRGDVGEIVIGGIPVGPGYLDDPQGTTRSFRSCPSKPGARVYHTGDRGRLRADGRIECLGRVDRQLKVRGGRVDLAEVEAHLSALPSVQNAAVSVYGEGEAGRLWAHIVLAMDALERPSLRSAAAERMEELWKELFDTDVYEGAPAADPTFNLVGWNSSYDRQPFPPHEMAEWLGQIVQRILGLRPRRVIEAGCGAGLIMFQVAPHCDAYSGWDYSARALDYVRNRLEAAGLAREGVQLALRRLEELEEVEAGEVDLVIFNSVAQYLPDAATLKRVVAAALRAVAPDGQVFLGDLLALPLKRSHAAAAAGDAATRAELKGRVEARSESDELWIAPAYFDALASELSEIGEIRVCPRRGAGVNELTTFRYDVVLHAGASSKRAPDGPSLEGSSVTLASLARFLEAESPAILRLSQVPNSRVLPALDRARWGDAPGSPDDCVPGLTASHGLDPEALCEVAEMCGYQIELSWRRLDATGAFDAILLLESDSVHWDPIDVAAMFPRDVDPENASSHTNDPSLRHRRRALEEEIRHDMRSQLPEFMVPSGVSILDAFPLTPTGKLDRRALPAPTIRSTRTVPPRNDLERTLVELWTELLHVEPIGIEDDFFEFGGNSLLAMRVVGAIQERLGREVSVPALFETPTIAALARLVESIDTESIAISRQPRASTARTSGEEPHGR